MVLLAMQAMGQSNDRAPESRADSAITFAALSLSARGHPSRPSLACSLDAQGRATFRESGDWAWSVEWFPDSASVRVLRDRLTDSLRATRVLDAGPSAASREADAGDRLEVRDLAGTITRLESLARGREDVDLAESILVPRDWVNAGTPIAWLARHQRPDGRWPTSPEELGCDSRMTTGCRASFGARVAPGDGALAVDAMVAGTRGVDGVRYSPAVLRGLQTLAAGVGRPTTATRPDRDDALDAVLTALALRRGVTVPGAGQSAIERRARDALAIVLDPAWRRSHVDASTDDANVRLQLQGFLIVACLVEPRLEWTDDAPALRALREDVLSSLAPSGASSRGTPSDPSSRALRAAVELLAIDPTTSGPPDLRVHALRRELVDGLPALLADEGRPDLEALLLATLAINPGGGPHPVDAESQTVQWNRAVTGFVRDSRTRVGCPSGSFDRTRIRLGGGTLVRTTALGILIEAAARRGM